MSNIDSRPYVGVAHVNMFTNCMQESQKFVVALGMRTIFEGPEISIYELKGGTHLILQRRDEEFSGEAPFDLMVEDIKEAHIRYQNLGLNPSLIEKRPNIEHEVFFLVDPAGNRITVYSNHTSGEPV